MGRTYKRDPHQDDYDDLDLIDESNDDEADLLEWMTRPNETRRPRQPSGRSTSRALPDDWHDFDYGGDSGDTIWR